MRGWILAILIAASLVAPAIPESIHVFLRNRAVVGYQVGSEVYVSPDELSRLLTADELGRIKVDPTTWQVQVDGQALSVTGPGVPIVALAQAIGFSKKLSNGLLDLVPPQSKNDQPAVEVIDSSKRSEYKEAARRLEQILKVFPKCNDPVGQARIDRIGNRVVRVTPLAAMKWTFVLVDAPMANAACVGEGHVFVTKPLLDLGVTDDELAGVLGHEIAHGVRRHPFRRVGLIRDIRELLVDYERLQRQVYNAPHYDITLRNQVESYQRRRDDLQYKFDHETRYSQLDEEEADVLGLRYAVLAGYSPDGLGSCLRKLEQDAIDEFGTAVLNDDMSHPPVKRRLEILKIARDHGKF